MLCMPKASVLQTIGHELLHNEVTRIVVRIFVTVAVSQFFHQLGGSITQMKRHRLVAGLPHKGQSGVDA